VVSNLQCSAQPLRVLITSVELGRGGSGLGDWAGVLLSDRETILV
jgi:hypothetical protein